MALAAPLREIADVVVVGFQAGLSKPLHPEPASGGHADGTTGELADEFVAAALSRAGAETLLDKRPDELERFRDLRVSGVRAFPQETAGERAHVAGVEAVP